MQNTRRVVLGGIWSRVNKNLKFCMQVYVTASLGHVNHDEGAVKAKRKAEHRHRRAVTRSDLLPIAEHLHHWDSRRQQHTDLDNQLCLVRSRHSVTFL